MELNRARCDPGSPCAFSSAPHSKVSENGRLGSAERAARAGWGDGRGRGERGVEGGRGGGEGSRVLRFQGP
jgi:hypothetical protein